MSRQKQHFKALYHRVLTILGMSAYVDQVHQRDLRVTLKFRGLRVEIAFKMLNFENNRSLKIRIKSGMRLTKLIPAAFFST